MPSFRKTETITKASYQKGIVIKMQNIVIGGAWPYANGSLHIGHIAALLPGDVLARYHRARGDQVFYVSGSDCHGTPITVRAQEEGETPRQISDRYHREFCKVFEALGFSYDLYTKTSDRKHRSFVKEFHRELYRTPYIEERTVSQAFCAHCQKTLTGRQIVGTCPHCGAAAHGDQCDACGALLEADSVVAARCAVCGGEVSFGETEHLFILISGLREELCAYLDAHPHWRKNAIAFTKRYIDEGLRDRAITRDLTWGIRVPRAEYEYKRIYIWAENVLGYLSATATLCDARGVDFRTVFGEEADTRHYYVHGKDNIPFHTIILPALLLAHGGGWHLPDEIVSSEYLTLDGEKISTSRDHAIWAKDLVEQYDPDVIRYFLLANGPERRNADFSLREFRERTNADLVGAWGNFVNRTLAFIAKYQDHRLPTEEVSRELTERVARAYAEVGERIEKGCFKEALEIIFDTVRFGNQYYDAAKPWKTRTEDPAACRQALADCVYLIANLAVLLHPFLPLSCEKLFDWLEITPEWKPREVTAEFLPEDISVLYTRIEEV